MADYSKHKMNDYSDILEVQKRFPDIEEYKKYLSKVFLRMLAMQPGECFLIDDNVIPENRDTFIKCVCLFMQGGAIDWQFSEDFTTIKRLL